MNLEAIDKAFGEMITKRGLYKKLGISQESASQYRKRFREGLPIKTETKILLLQRSGWVPEQSSFTRNDMIAFVKFYNRASENARSMGIEYVLEKWLLRKK